MCQIKVMQSILRGDAVMMIPNLRQLVLWKFCEREKEGCHTVTPQVTTCVTWLIRNSTFQREFMLWCSCESDSRVGDTAVTHNDGEQWPNLPGDYPVPHRSTFAIVPATSHRCPTQFNWSSSPQSSHHHRIIIAITTIITTCRRWTSSRKRHWLLWTSKRSGGCKTSYVSCIGWTTNGQYQT